MTRFTAAQFAAAAAAGVPRASAEFADDDAWQEYQQSWLEVFRPHEKLPPPEDKQRRLVWKAATRQHGKIEAARNAAAAVNIVLVAAPQPPSHGSSSLPGDTDAEASGVAVVEAAAATGAAAANVAALAAEAAIKTTTNDADDATEPNQISVAAEAQTPGSGHDAKRPKSQPTAEELAKAAAVGSPRAGDINWLGDFLGPWVHPGQKDGCYPTTDLARDTLWDWARREHARLSQQLQTDAANTTDSAAVAVASAMTAAKAADAATQKLRVALQVIRLNPPGATPMRAPTIQEDADRVAQLMDEAEVAGTLAATATGAAEAAVDVAALTSAASIGAQHTAGSLVVRRHRLQVRDAWMHRHTPAIQRLEVATPSLTPQQQHAVRRLCAHGIGPDDEPMVRSDQVRYSLPPAEGESSSAGAQRMDRHLRREQNALLRLNRRLTDGDVELHLEQLERAAQEHLEQFAAQAAELCAEAESEKAWALALKEGLWARMTDEDRERVEAAAKEREEALSRKAAERAKQRAARRHAEREQAKRDLERAEIEAARKEMADREAAATVVEVKRREVPSWQQVLDQAQEARLRRYLPVCSYKARRRQRRVALRDIFNALHVPHHILVPGNETVSRPDRLVDFGLGSFARTGKFFACMETLYISLEPGLLTGQDENGDMSFYVCLREYRDVLRYHDEHNHLLEAELEYAANDPEYRLPSIRDLYQFPRLNRFAAAAASLTYHENVFNSRCASMNDWRYPGLMNHARYPGHFWWQSDLHRRYDVERRWQIQLREREANRFLGRIDSWAPDGIPISRAQFERHWQDLHVRCGTFRHLSLDDAEVLCDGFEQYSKMLDLNEV